MATEAALPAFLSSRVCQQEDQRRDKNISRLDRASRV